MMFLVFRAKDERTRAKLAEPPAPAPRPAGRRLPLPPPAAPGQPVPEA